MTTGLKGRIFISLAAVSLVPLLVMSIQGYHCARSAVMGGTAARLAAIVTSRTSRLERVFASVDSDLRLLISGFHISAGTAVTAPSSRDIKAGASRSFQDIEPVCNVADSLLATEPSYLSVAVYDAAFHPTLIRSRDNNDDGFSVLPADETKRRASQSDGLYIDIANRTGKGGISGIFIRPLPSDGKRDPRGFVSITADLTKAIDSVVCDRRGLGPSETAGLYYPTGRLIASCKHIAMPSQLAAGDLTSSNRQSSPMFTFRGNGDVFLAVSRPVAGPGWFVTAAVSREEALEPLGRIVGTAFLTAFACLLIVLLLAGWNASRLSAPLARLADTARRIGQGEHTLRAEHCNDPEMDEVARAFNTMLDELAGLRRRAAADASLAAIGELSSSMVHEIRNPLSAIKMNLESLAEAVADDDFLSESAGIAISQVDRLEGMLNELLRYARPVTPRMQDIDCAEMLMELEALVSSEASKKAVRLHFNAEGDLDTFRADREMMVRAVDNLVRNAVQSSPEGGTVRLHLGAARNIPKGIEFVVSDEGPGVPEHLRDEIFKPFVSTRDGGTGLGLANVRKTALVHGGTVSVAAGEEGGAVFTLTIATGER